MNRSGLLASIGPIRSGNQLIQVKVSQDEIIYKTLTGLSRVETSYPVAGARAQVEHEQSGYRKHHHMITITIMLADGQQLVIIQQADRNAGLKAVAKARQFSAGLRSAAAVAERIEHGATGD